MEEIDKIFRRQFQRCKGDLISVNCPQIYIDCFSKYMDFASEDVATVIRNMENGMDKNTNR